MEVAELLKKGAITSCTHQTGEFISNLFLVGKKDGGHRPVINLKHLNQFVPYQHFKMEGLHYLKFLLQEEDYMCKLDLKDAYFSVPLHKDSRKLIRFPWSGNLYEFLCLCFGLGPAPNIFTKILKVPIALLRRLNIKVIIYLDDMIMMASSIEALLTARDTVIYLLQHLGFIINLKKSVLVPTQKMKFLGLIIDSVAMTLSLTKQKLHKIMLWCSQTFNNPKVSILELTKLIGVMSSTVQAVLPARIQFRYLQQQQILSFQNNNNNYSQLIVLNNSSKEELLWRINNLKMSNGRCLVQPQPQVVMQTDASKTGWGGNVQGNKDWGSLVTGGTEVSYQCLGTSSSQISPHNIYKKSKLKINSFSNRQYNSLVISTQNGRNKKSCVDTAEQGHMGYITNQGDHNFCRVPAQYTECDSRSGISHTPLNRMEIASKGVCNNLQKVGHTITRPVCLTRVSPNPSLCSVEARSTTARQQMHFNRTGQIKFYTRFPHFAS